MKSLWFSLVPSEMSQNVSKLQQKWCIFSCVSCLNKCLFVCLHITMLDESAYRVIRILLEAISTPEPLTTTYPYVDVTANHINVPTKPILNASSSNFLLARPPQIAKAIPMLFGLRESVKEGKRECRRDCSFFFFGCFNVFLLMRIEILTNIHFNSRQKI